MIIAFYPGAGGNRFVHYLQGLEWQTPGKSYDQHVPGQTSLARYPNEHSRDPLQQDLILTHSVNTQMIQRIWPGHEIYVILSDLQISLRREWVLEGHARYKKKMSKQNLDRIKLELYQAIRDPGWPEISTIEDLARIPDSIHHELQKHWQERSAPADEVTQYKRHLTDQVDSAMAQIEWHKDYYTRYPLDISAADHVIDLDDRSEFAKTMRQELERYQSEIFDRCWNMIYG